MSVESGPEFGDEIGKVVPRGDLGGVGGFLREKTHAGLPQVLRDIHQVTVR